MSFIPQLFVIVLLLHSSFACVAVQLDRLEYLSGVADQQFQALKCARYHSFMLNYRDSLKYLGESEENKTLFLDEICESRILGLMAVYVREVNSKYSIEWPNWRIHWKER